MAAGSAAAGRWLSSVPLRYLGIYLIYLATLVRAVDRYEGTPGQGPLFALLLIFGGLLFLEPRLTGPRGWRSWAYGLVQFGLVVGIQLLPDEPEMLSTLFIPLSLQAVHLFGRRIGFAWIAIFALAIAEPVMSGFDSAVVGLAMILMYSGFFVLMGRYADLLRGAEAARNENQRLLGDLQVAHRRLEDYARQLEEFAAAQERSRLARELHDSVTQTIFGMNLTAQTARMLWDMDRSRVSGQLDRLQELAHGATGEIQLLVSHLRPRAVTEGGLALAIRRVIAERERLDGLRVRLEVSGGAGLPESVVAGLCRIVQEALHNVAKHARTTEAIVRLDLETEPRWLEIADDGVGFDPNEAHNTGGHMGLAGMAERASELGWKLTCVSQKGRGTRIRVEEA